MNLEAYAKKIFGFALTKTNNAQDAEDLSERDIHISFRL